jgi:hypothetical protein
MNKAKNNILFIEITDAEICFLLGRLREIFSNKIFNTNIHISIKGPQKTFRKDSVNKFVQKKNPIEIYDAGMFVNKDKYFVYLKVECEDLETIWRKPDYDSEYNPHITLYKGTNKRIADAIFNFLKNENLCFACTEYSIAVHTLRQRNLFTQNHHPETHCFDMLIAKGGVKRGILLRAEEMMSDLLQLPLFNLANRVLCP